MSDDGLPRSIWDLAWDNPNQEIDVGRLVYCDDCGNDYTDSDDVGGILFQSKALCPGCAPQWRKGAIKHGEEKYIRAIAEPGETFADFARRMRGGVNTICVTTLNERVDGLGWKNEKNSA